MEDPTKILHETPLGETGVREAPGSEPRIDPARVYTLFQAMQDGQTEKLVSIAVSRDLDILNFDVIAIGPLTGIMREPKYLFRSPVVFAAAGVVVVHNHSSGDPTPGPDDLLFHERIMGTYRQLGIAFHDHVIVGDGRFYSLKADKEYPC